MYSYASSTIQRLCTVVAVLIGIGLLSSWCASAEAATLPTLPQVFIDTTYSPPSGNTITVNAGGNLQTAVNNALPGDTIVVQAGATFPGSVTLPNKTTGSGWIYIQSSAYSSLPAPGTRVSPSDAVNMPTITITAASGSAAILTAAKAHHFRFVGIEVRPVANNFIYDLIDVGAGETTLAALPNNIVFDRCYIHGDPAVGGRRGVAMNGASVAVVDSYLSDFKENGGDSQALWSYNTPGPLKIVNNFLEAAAENVLFGGAEPAITNVLPSDIEIRGNHIFKPLSWVGSQWTIKNLLELKLGIRVLVEGNTFENSWLMGQDGEAIVITPRDEYGSATWAATQDITIRLNKIVNVGKGVNISGRDNPNVSQITHRVLIENNLLSVAVLQGSSARIFQVTNGPTDITIRHNTAFTVPGGATAMTDSSPDADQLDFRDNIMSRGDYGFAGAGTGEGTPTLNAFYTNYTFLKNAIIGAPASSYPASNFFPSTTAAVGFANFSGGDYHLAASSPYKNAATDGKDLGADIDALAAALNGAGTAQLPAPTNLRTIN